MATYLLAILDRPGVLLALCVWFLSFVRDQILGEFLSRHWRKMPAGMRELLLPPEDHTDPHLYDSRELEELRREVTNLRARISELEQKPQEDRDRLARLEDEVRRLRRPWWRHWLQ